MIDRQGEDSYCDMLPPPLGSPLAKRIIRVTIMLVHCTFWIDEKTACKTALT